jgi:hypothetical protein
MTDCEGPPKEKPHHGLGRGGVPGPITDRGGRGATEATLVGGTAFLFGSVRVIALTAN